MRGFIIFLLLCSNGQDVINDWAGIVLGGGGPYCNFKPGEKPPQKFSQSGAKIHMVFFAYLEVSRSIQGSLRRMEKRLVKIEDHKKRLHRLMGIVVI